MFRTSSTTLLQISCKFNLNSKVIVKIIKVSDDNFEEHLVSLNGLNYGRGHCADITKTETVENHTYLMSSELQVFNPLALQVRF